MYHNLTMQLLSLTVSLFTIHSLSFSLRFTEYYYKIHTVTKRKQLYFLRKPCQQMKQDFVQRPGAANFVSQSRCKPLSISQLKISLKSAWLAGLNGSAWCGQEVTHLLTQLLAFTLIDLWKTLRNSSAVASYNKKDWLISLCWTEKRTSPFSSRYPSKT